jgi:hypothetical protein
MSNELHDALRSVALFVPKLVAFLAILVIGYFIAKLVGKAVDKVLERVGFDRAVERGGVKKALSKSKYDASDVVGKLVYYALLLFVLQMAFGVFGPNPISVLLTGVIAFLPKAIVAVVIIVVTAAIAAAVRELLSNTLGGLSYGRTLANIAAFFIIGLGVIAALNQVGIATTVTLPVLVAVLATISGILIVGVGGGLIKPMQSRWETYLNAAAAEAGAIRQEVRRAPSVQDQARAAKYRYSDQEDPTMSPQGGTGSAYVGDDTTVFDQTAGGATRVDGSGNGSSHY